MSAEDVLRAYNQVKGNRKKEKLLLPFTEVAELVKSRDDLYITIHRKSELDEHKKSS